MKITKAFLLGATENHGHTPQCVTVMLTNNAWYHGPLFDTVQDIIDFIQHRGTNDAIFGEFQRHMKGEKCARFDHEDFSSLIEEYAHLLFDKIEHDHAEACFNALCPESVKLLKIKNTHMPKDTPDPHKWDEEHKALIAAAEKARDMQDKKLDAKGLLPTKDMLLEEAKYWRNKARETKRSVNADWRFENAAKLVIPEKYHHAKEVMNNFITLLKLHAFPLVKQIMENTITRPVTYYGDKGMRDLAATIAALKAREVKALNAFNKKAKALC